MLCISRITDDSLCQYFGNNHNKFYIELRCNLPCSAGNDVCSKCSEKIDTCKLQTSRRFNHGKVNEPIPDISHIYGGKWYYENVTKYKEPSDEIIKFAEKYQKDARGNFEVIQPTIDTTIPIKKSRKPKVAPDASSNLVVKKGRKPKVAPESHLTETNQVIIDSTTKPSRKKKDISPYSNLISIKSTLVHKEVTLPTHIETEIEELDLDDSSIEYVSLSLFEHNGSSYYIDIKKGKLYKKVKDKIGPYVGRYHTESETIITDIPDSDDEE